MNVEVKIQCDCGTRYKFDVEPLHGRMPQKVSCPHCGVDGTPAANGILRAKQGRSGTLSSAPSGGEGWGEEVKPPPPALDAHLGDEPERRAPARRVEEDQIRAERGLGAPVHGQRDRFGLGLAGAVLAAVLAMLAWFFLIKVTGYPLGFAAWAVGLLVGLGARGLGRAGSRRLGLAAGACAFVAILGGQMLAARSHAGTLKAGLSEGGVGWLTLLWLVMAVLSAFKLAASRPREGGTKGWPNTE